MPEPQVQGTTEAKPRPSLRRVLAGYLRLRSPYNLCLDAGLVVLASYLLTSGRRWIAVGMGRGPSETFSGWWALNEAAEIGVGMLYLAGLGMFLIACARIIAERPGRSEP